MSLVGIATQDEALAEHLDRVVKRLTERRVIPFLGAAVNLCDRPLSFHWTPDQSEYLPGGAELSEYLAEEFMYRESDRKDLLRVSLHTALEQGERPLYEKLHDVFSPAYPPTSVHRLLANIPRVLREKGYRSAGDPDVQRYIIVTTNYDCVLEQAFRDAGESFHLLWYMNAVNPELKGKFLHSPPGGQPEMIRNPDEYLKIKTDPDQYPIIIKIHGAVNQSERDSDEDSYVITEEDYVDYLTRLDAPLFLPAPSPVSFLKNHFLFLGYSLRDWNMRAMLYRVWRQRRRSIRSWAIQLHPQIMDEKLWSKMDVDIIDCDLHHYVDLLGERIGKLEPARGKP